jgi:hypothetical protein
MAEINLDTIVAAGFKALSINSFSAEINLDSVIAASVASLSITAFMADVGASEADNFQDMVEFTLNISANPEFISTVTRTGTFTVRV